MGLVKGTMVVFNGCEWFQKMVEAFACVRWGRQCTFTPLAQDTELLVFVTRGCCLIILQGSTRNSPPSQWHASRVQKAGKSRHPRCHVFTAHITCENKSPRKYNFLPHYRSYTFRRLEYVKIFSPESQKRYSIFCPQPQGRWHNTCWASLNSGDGVYDFLLLCPDTFAKWLRKLSALICAQSKKVFQLVQTTVQGC